MRGFIRACAVGALALVLASKSLHAISAFTKPKVDTSDVKRGWELDLNRLSLNFSQSSLTNQNLYKKFSDSNLKGNSQLSLQFFLTLNAIYYARRFVIFNSMAIEYGFTEVKKDNQDAVRNKNLDKFLLSTDYTQRVWEFDWGFESFEVGPYVKFSYQTEFTPPEDIGRKQNFIYMFGAKLFDGTYIKGLYMNVFGEHDANPRIGLNSLGLEMGVELEYKFNENVKFLYLTSYKHYLFHGEDSVVKPQYQLLIETRIDAKLFKGFSIAPMLRYYLIEARDIKVPASNLVIGVSFSFKKILMNSNKATKGAYDFSN